MRWLACELHTHTLHSDGSQTLEELANGAAGLGFDAIALTDHNTMSGLIGKEEIERRTGLHILPGMEWTTFYGHMVTIGLGEYVDWRQAERGGIDEGIAGVHRFGGLAGLAHPFRIGSPACTGCFWEYEIGDWNAVDYIEVWSGTSPSIQTDNRRAFELWTDKLNEGYRLAATSGRDWHNQNATDESISVTYLGIEEQEASLLLSREALRESETQALIRALRQGRASVTIGPLLTMAVESGGRSYGIGSVVPAATEDAISPVSQEAGNRATESFSGSASDSLRHSPSIRVHLTLDFSVRSGLWSLPEQKLRLKLCSERGEEQELEVQTSDEWTAGKGDDRDDDQVDPVSTVSPVELTVELPNDRPADSAAASSADPAIHSSRLWLRAELWGTVRGAYIRIAFTNAIYFDAPEGANR